MRIIIMAVATLLAFAGAIHAQVAAPRLNPIAIESSKIDSTKPSNPATLSWSGPSRVGAGFLDVEREDEPVGGPVTLDAEGDGTLWQARWVGEMFAVGAEIQQIDLDLPGGGSEEFDSSLVGVAFQGGEIFSIGIGQETREITVPGASQEETLPFWGATLRLVEVLYLGVATGDATVERTVGGITAEADRSVTRFGVAYQWRDGDHGLHLEVYREERDSISTPTLGEDEEETDGFTVEIVFANILIGAEFITTDFNDNAGVFQMDQEETTLSLGWAPGQGLAIVASLVENEETDNIGNAKTTDTTSIAVAWLF